MLADLLRKSNAVILLVICSTVWSLLSLFLGLWIWCGTVHTLNISSWKSTQVFETRSLRWNHYELLNSHQKCISKVYSDPYISNNCYSNMKRYRCITTFVLHLESWMGIQSGMSSLLSFLSEKSVNTDWFQQVSQYCHCDSNLQIAALPLSFSKPKDYFCSWRCVSNHLQHTI